MNVRIRMSLLLALPLVAGLAVLTPRAAVADTSSGMGIAAPADDAPPPQPPAPDSTPPQDPAPTPVPPADLPPPPPEKGADPKEAPAPAPVPPSAAPRGDPMAKLPRWAPPPLAGETLEDYQTRTGWTYSPM